VQGQTGRGKVARTNRGISFRDDWYKEARLAAVEDGVTLNILVETAVRDYLDRRTGGR